MFALNIILFLFGASLGSFVNVIALRYGTGLSPFKGNSKCFSCGKKLRFYELIPVFSYLSQKGRCRACGSKFSLQYLLVEIVSGLIVVWLYHYFQFSIFNFQAIFQFSILILIFEILILIFLYDLHHKIIPDAFLIAFAVLSLLYSYLVAHASFLDLFISAILISLPFLLIWIFSSGRAFGFGDVKFIAVMGLLLGFKVGLSSVFLAFWLGLAYVLIKIFFKFLGRISGLRGGGKQLTMKSELPFAPFLVIGTLIGLFFQIKLF